MKAVGLHGRSQTGEVFRTRLEKLVQSTSSTYTWEFPDAPHLIQEPGSRDRVKSWYEADKLTWDTLPFVSNNNPQVLVGFSQGGLIAIAAALKMKSVRLVIVAGAPSDNGNWLDEFFTKASRRCNALEIHFLAGNDDQVVLKQTTRALHDRVKMKMGDMVTCIWEEFEGKHQFPNNSKYVQRFTALFTYQEEIVESKEALELQQEEIEILKSIYGEDDTQLKLSRSAPQQVCEPGIKLVLQVSSEVTLECTAKRNYPLQGSRLALHVVSSKTAAIPQHWMRQILQTEQDLQGEARIFACVSALQEAMLIEEVASLSSQQEEEETEEQLYARVEKCTILARDRLKVSKFDEEDDTRRGEWKLCVGLLGKPSAGKSSFFNCCTTHTTQLGLAKANQAEVGAQPFTTIDPHFGVATCQYGEDFQCTVQIKDVAGLVPGAYRGLGKGNRFLNDLLDASSLLHICDGSGASDDGGNIAQLELNPKQVSRDALWVLREVHLWIYGNISNKWPSQSKKPGDQVATRVCQLFAGYHAPPGMVTRASKLAGLDLNNAAMFSAEERHLLVACFIAIRFPVVLALNKFDEVKNAEDGTRRGEEIYNAAVKAMGGLPQLVVPMSAKLEGLRLATGNGLASDTGVEQALVRAIQVAQPLVVTAITGNVRRTKFFFYPNSQVYDLYQTCLRKKLVAGDFVRAEDGLTGKALPREAWLRDHPEVKILTNRKL